MAYDPTDAVTARALLDAALALTSTPTLETATVDLLFGMASSEDADANTVYLAADLNRSVSLGWNLKAGLTADQYDLRAASGASLTRDQWWAHCMAMANAYGTGAMSVTGTSTGRGGIRSIGQITGISADYWEAQA